MLLLGFVEVNSINGDDDGDNCDHDNNFNDYEDNDILTFKCNDDV